MASLGANISHGHGVAAYNPPLDKIVMPAGGDFTSKESYYATLLHELTHWTGHKARLDRLPESIIFGNPKYAYEELVAELGAAFLCAELGIKAELQHHASYLEHWISKLREDPKVIFDAAKHASKATAFMREIGEPLCAPSEAGGYELPAAA